MRTIDLEYYQTTWNLNLLKCRKELSTDGTKFRYERCFRLTNDHILTQAGITICARVDVDGESCINYIVFKHRNQETMTKINHTRLFEGQITQINEIGVPKLQMLLPSKTQILVDLVPEEHFVALQQYVETLRDEGILIHMEDLLQNTIYLFPLKKRLLKALYDLSPQIFMRMLEENRPNYYPKTLQSLKKNPDYALKIPIWLTPDPYPEVIRPTKEVTK
jgi:hypothetical protein